MQELFQSPNNVSLLSFQPYQALDESSCPFWLWKVMIDGHVFSENMSPVRACDDRVERNTCTACGQPGCGGDFYVVRRLGDKILWIYEELFDSEKSWSFENLPQSFVFDGAAYEKLLDSGRVASLPELTTDEMLTFIVRYLPPSSCALYVCPESIDDSLGSGLLESTRLAFAGRQDGIARISDPPSQFVEITIGLDLLGFPECRWVVGSNKGQTCVMFLAYPNLPCWISWDDVASTFGALCES